MAGPKAADELAAALLDVSWIRAYLLLRATSQRISSAEVVADLERLGFTYSPLSIARIMRGLENKGYLAQTLPRKGSGRIRYRTTAKGRIIGKAFRRHLREFFEHTSPVESPTASPRR